MIWRIRERSAFARLAAEGRRARAGVLWCTHLPDSSAVPPRVAFAIGRAAGPAVSRNLLRRRLRALLAQCSDPQLTLAPGWYLFGVRVHGAPPSYDELAFEMERLLRTLRG